MRRLHRAAVVGGAAVASLALAGPALAYYALTSTTAAAQHPVATLTQVRDLTAGAEVVDHLGVVDLSWSPPAGPAGATGLRYTVTRDGSPVCTAVAATACRVTGLAPSSSSTYAVRPLLGSWTGPAATTTATVPADVRLLVVAPPTAVAGTPFTVTLTARNGALPDASAVGTRNLAVTGASPIGTHTPTDTVAVTFSTQPDGSVTGTATVRLVKAESAALTFTDIADPSRTGTTAPVVVRPGAGTLAFADCQGPTGYVCGSRTRLDGAVVSAVVTRSATDALGNAQELGEASVTLSLSNDKKALLAPDVVRFAAGQTSSERFLLTPAVGANGNLTVESTTIPEHAAPAPLSLML